MRGRRRSAGLVALVALVAVGAACSPTSNEAAPLDRAATARKAARQLELAQRSAVGCDNVVMSEERRTTKGPEHLVQLTEAYAVAEPCWDKIVFTFEPTGADMPPGYEVEYRKPPFTEGDEGQYTVETLGDAFLYLTFTPASSREGGDPTAPQTYKGPLRLGLENTHHTEIVRKLIDGEGTVMWLVGLDTKRPFTVDAANSPPRVTLYIAR